MIVNGLPLPAELVVLIMNGKWPTSPGEANRQNFTPHQIPPDRVRRIAQEENQIFLYPPPFSTGLVLRSDGPQFWGAPDQTTPPGDIIFDRSLLIGDFGPGSDAPIALDYREDLNEPSVIRLRWSLNGDQNRWVYAANSFREFAELLAL